MSKKSTKIQGVPSSQMLQRGLLGASIIPSLATAKDSKQHIDELIRAKQNFTANDQVQIAFDRFGWDGSG